jgi:voltage-gated potassium channel
MGRRVRLGIGLLAAVLLYGGLGFHELLHDSWLQSLFNTVAVMSTVRGVTAARPIPLVFLTVLMVVGTAVWIFWVSIVVSIIVQNDLGFLQEMRRKGQVRRMKDHFVVLGAGQVGRSIALELREQGESVIVADTDPDRIARMAADGFLTAKLDRVDLAGGVEVNIASARGVALAWPDDAQNLYAYLSVKDVNPQILVVARAQTAQAAHYLRSLGIERVILPDIASGRRMARMLTKPVAHDLLMAMLEEEGVQVTEVLVDDRSDMAHQPVAQVRQVFGEDVTLIGLWREGKTHMGPRASDIIHPGDTLILLHAGLPMPKVEGG